VMLLKRLVFIACVFVALSLWMRYPAEAGQAIRWAGHSMGAGVDWTVERFAAFIRA
jgi:hypothetical protein